MSFEEESMSQWKEKFNEWITSVKNHPFQHNQNTHTVNGERGIPNVQVDKKEPNKQELQA